MNQTNKDKITLEKLKAFKAEVLKARLNALCARLVIGELYVIGMEAVPAGRKDPEVAKNMYKPMLYLGQEDGFYVFLLENKKLYFRADLTDVWCFVNNDTIYNLMAWDILTGTNHYHHDV